MNENNKKRAEGLAKEVGGKIQKTAGRVVGDEQLEAQGRANELDGADQQRTAKAAERAKGAVEEAAGAIKRGVGAVVGDEKIEAEGKARELGGRARQAANKP